MPDPAEAVTHLWSEGTDADTAQVLLDEWAAVVEQAGQGNGMAEPLPREAQAGSRWFLPSSDTEDRGGAQRAGQ